MREYLEEQLKMNIMITEDKNIYKGLPLIYKSLYKIYTVSSNGVVWLALEPKDKLGLSQLRKNRAYLEKMKQVNCDRAKHLPVAFGVGFVAACAVV